MKNRVTIIIIMLDLLAELEGLDAVPLPVGVVRLERLLFKVFFRLLLVRARLCMYCSILLKKQKIIRVF